MIPGGARTRIFHCQATLGPLPCTRPDAHLPHRGCVFLGTSGTKRAPREDALVLSGRRGRQS